MASVARKVRRKRIVEMENKVTGRTELFRKSKYRLIYTGISYKKPSYMK